MDEETGAIHGEVFVTLAMKSLTYVDNLLAHYNNIRYVEYASSIYMYFSFLKMAIRHK